jgi:hypothetical protein
MYQLHQFPTHTKRRANVGSWSWEIKGGKHYTESNLDWYEIGVAAAMPARSIRFNAGAAASVAAKVVSLPEFVKTYQAKEKTT